MGTPLEEVLILLVNTVLLEGIILLGVFGGITTPANSEDTDLLNLILSKLIYRRDIIKKPSMYWIISRKELQNGSTIAQLPIWA
jgi:hypothetical protein